MKLLTSADKSNMRVAVKEMADQMRKINTLKEDIKETSKGLAEKYKDDGESLTASVFIKMAQLELNKDKIVEKQEKAQTPYDYYSLIMEDGE